MEFRIADTFTDSLARLTGDEQKAVKTTEGGKGSGRKGVRSGIISFQVDRVIHETFSLGRRSTWQKVHLTKSSAWWNNSPLMSNLICWPSWHSVWARW